MCRFITAIIIVFIISGCKSLQNSKQNEKNRPLEWAIQLADSDIKRNPDPRLLDFRPQPKWEYTNGLICGSMIELWKNTKNSKYLNYAQFYADSMISTDGKILTYKKSEYNIDRINPGKMLIDLFELTNTPKYKMAIDTLRDQMRSHPKTSEGGFWHKKVYPHQMWLDGLYMGTPFLSKYAQYYNEPSLFDEVVKQILIIDKHTYDERTGLYYHGWDESKTQQWADPKSGLSPHIWGRAMGWFAMALTDNLEYIPVNHPGRKEVIAIFNKVVKGLQSHQDAKTGLWYQIMDMPSAKGNYLEASCSAMFTYALFKGINLKVIDKDQYLPTAIKAYNGILQNLIKQNPDGSISLTQICAVAGLGGNPYRDGSYTYYINEPKRDDDPKGVGPFILASLEYEKL